MIFTRNISIYYNQKSGKFTIFGISYKKIHKIVKTPLFQTPILFSNNYKKYLKLLYIHILNEIYIY